MDGCGLQIIVMGVPCFPRSLPRVTFSVVRPGLAGPLKTLDAAFPPSPAAVWLGSPPARTLYPELGSLAMAS